MRLIRSWLREINPRLWRTPEARARRQRLLERMRHPALMPWRRMEPLSDHWGYERGVPIDRYYIEQFLDGHRDDIHGHVLEVKDREYTNRYGADVTRSDVLDDDPSNHQVTVMADLSVVGSTPVDQYDCFIMTQTLQYIFHVADAIQNAYRTLRPGGVLLATVPAISRVDSRHMADDYWRFTPASCRALFGSTFGSEYTRVVPYGNVLAAGAFLYGMAQEELPTGGLDAHNAAFAVVIAVRATKAERRNASDQHPGFAQPHVAGDSRT